MFSRQDFCGDHKCANVDQFVVSTGMFVKWRNRSRAYTRRRNNGPHRTLIAQLFENRRVGGQSRRRMIAHLGTCREPVETPRHRMWFYQRCDEVLARLGLSAEDRDQIAAQLQARLKRPTEAEFKAEQEEWDRHERALGAALGRPDGFATLVKAWTAADQSERERFIDELRKAGAA
jgi:hypothetical protein